MSFSVYLSNVFCFELLMFGAFLAVPYLEGTKSTAKKESKDTKPTSPPEKRSQWNTVKTPAGFVEFFFQWNTPSWILSKAPKSSIYLVPEVPMGFHFLFSINGPCFLLFLGVAIFSSLSEFHFKGKIFPSPESLQGELLLAFKRSYKPYK